MAQGWIRRLMHKPPRRRRDTAGQQTTRPPRVEPAAGTASSPYVSRAATHSPDADDNAEYTPDDGHPTERFLAQRAELLALCSERGVVAVVDEIIQRRNGNNDGGLLTDHNQALEELLQLESASDRQSLDRRVALCRVLLDWIDRQGEGRELWASIQGTLGIQLLRRGEQDQDPLVLYDAVAAFREALEIYTREKYPQRWAQTHANVGEALLAIGQRSGDLSTLSAAVKSYTQALQIYSKQTTPNEWAEIQNLLGIALRRRGSLGDPHSLAEAIEAYQQILEIRTREKREPTGLGRGSNEPRYCAVRPGGADEQYAPSDQGD